MNFSNQLNQLTQLQKNDIEFNKEYESNLIYMTTFKTSPKEICLAKVNYVPEYVWKIYFDLMYVENKLDLPFVYYLKRNN